MWYTSQTVFTALVDALGPKFTRRASGTFAGEHETEKISADAWIRNVYVEYLKVCFNNASVKNVDVGAPHTDMVGAAAIIEQRMNQDHQLRCQRVVADINVVSDPCTLR